MAAIVGGAALGSWAGLSPLGSAWHVSNAPGEPTTTSSDAAPTPPLPLTARGVAFRATSLGDGWGVEGDYGGRVTRRGSDIGVTVPTARLHVSADDDAPRELVGIRLALADSTEHGWRLVRAGPLHRLDMDLPPGGDLWLGRLDLTLPRVSDEELDGGRWLVIVHELATEGPDGWTPSWTYAQDDPATIVRLMGWTGDGC